MVKALILFFIFISSVAFGQEVMGKITNRSDFKIIAFASVFYKNRDLGTYTDSTGNFKISKIKNDTLIISSLGFHKLMIPVDSIEKFLNVSLSPDTIFLNEIIISRSNPQKRRNGKRIYLGNLSSERNHYFSGIPGRTIAYLIKPETQITGQIKSIHFGIEAKANAIVRTHLYTINKHSGYPSEDLIKTPMVLKVTKGSKNATFNVIDLNIELPPEGIFVGLEWLGEISGSNLLNISPTYTSSKSAKPVIQYVKFMDNKWIQISREFPAWQKKKNSYQGFYFDEPNFKIGLIQ